MDSIPYTTGPFGYPSAPAVDAALQHLSGGDSFPVLALLDTGAGISVVPKQVAVEAGWIPYKIKVIKTPYGSRNVFAYAIRIQVFSEWCEVEAVESERPFAIIGRDILNHFRVFFDGPSLSFQVIPPGVAFSNPLGDLEQS